MRLQSQAISGSVLLVCLLVTLAQAVPVAVLTWQYPPEKGQTHFVLYRRAFPSGTWEQRGIIAAEVRTFTDAGLSAGVRYSWVIRAVNAQGEGPPVTVSGTAPAAPPQRPVICEGVVDTVTHAVALDCRDAKP